MSQILNYSISQWTIGLTWHGTLFDFNPSTHVIALENEARDEGYFIQLRPYHSKLFKNIEKGTPLSISNLGLFESDFSENLYYKLDVKTYIEANSILVKADRLLTAVEIVLEPKSKARSH